MILPVGASTFKEAMKMGVEVYHHLKVVLSSSPSSAGNCTVVLRQNYRSLAFCNLGDESFTEFYPLPGYSDFISDLVFYKEQLYVVRSSNEVIIFPSGLRINSAPTTKFLLPTSFDEIILIVSCDKLLAVGCSARYPCHPVNAFEHNPSESKWVEVKTLGDNVLLISDECSISFSVEGQQDLRGNHMYYCGSLKRTLRSISLDDKADNNAKCRRPLFFDLFKICGFQH